MPTALTLIDCLSDLPDPRVENTRRHLLTDILVIAICAFLCGAEGWTTSSSSLTPSATGSKNA